jgi:lipopolysaccharide/colanic/teichoic acid biosynthesis glycosyltransferase
MTEEKIKELVIRRYTRVQSPWGLWQMNLYVHWKRHRHGITFKMKDDPRITRVGRWMRRYSLDELPQLFNVLLTSRSRCSWTYSTSRARVSGWI